MRNSVCTLSKTGSLVVCLLLSAGAFADERQHTTQPVLFVKVMLPEVAPPKPSPDNFPVEKWIQGALKKQGQAELRAVTSWVRLPSGEFDSVDVWNATVNGKSWGCPVGGSTFVQPDGRCKVELIGWTPGGADLVGNVITPEPGNRRIAKVGYKRGPEGEESGVQFETLAYVAIIVAPSEVASSEKTPDTTSDSDSGVKP
ncbi:MAG: hypothetical protein NXI04_23675 [Planctomycetaceae bacterium]|nr:hypothetical protein [Planctomycetaceae bacterium]